VRIIRCMTESEAETVEISKKEWKIVQSRLNNLANGIDIADERIQENENKIEELKNKNRELKRKMVGNPNLKTELNISDAERILINGWKNVSVDKTKVRERAMMIIRNYQNWSENVAAGKVLKINKYVRKIFEQEMGKNVNYMTMKRAYQAVEDMTNGKIKYVEDENKINHLMLCDDVDFYRNVEEVV